MFGQRIHPITGVKEFHKGIDIVAVGGDEVVAAKSGTVVRSRIVTDKSDATWQWGNYVAVQGSDGCTIYYCHLSTRAVRVGEKVTRGDLLGLQGATGQATGKHLHFEVRRNGESINAAEYLGIENKLGTYDDVYIAVKKLARAKVINTPEYWLKHCRDIPYLDELLVRCSDYVDGCRRKCATVEEAVQRLKMMRIINTPEYWLNNADKVEHLPELLKKLGANV